MVSETVGSAVEHVFTRQNHETPPSFFGHSLPVMSWPFSSVTRGPFTSSFDFENDIVMLDVPENLHADRIMLIRIKSDSTEMVQEAVKPLTYTAADL